MTTASELIARPQNFYDNVASAVALQDVSYIINALGSVSGAQTVNLELGNVCTLTATGSITFTFSNWPASGREGVILLKITNGSNLGATDLDGINWFLADGTTSTTFADVGLTLGTYNEILITSSDAGTTKYGWVS